MRDALQAAGHVLQECQLSEAWVPHFWCSVCGRVFFEQSKTIRYWDYIFSTADDFCNIKENREFWLERGLGIECLFMPKILNCAEMDIKVVIQ